MKFKSFLMGAVLITTAIASFAFKAPNRLGVTAYYVAPTNKLVCELAVTDEGCSTTGAGAQCTCYDPYSEAFVPAFELPNHLQGGCEYPMYYAH